MSISKPLWSSVCWGWCPQILLLLLLNAPLVRQCSLKGGWGEYLRNYLIYGGLGLSVDDLGSLISLNRICCFVNGYFLMTTSLQNSFNCEGNNAASNLDRLCLLFFQLDWLCGHNKCAKFTQIVLEEEALRVFVVILQKSMTARNWDITHAQIGLMTSAQLESVVFWIWLNHMDHPWRVLFKSERFKPQKIAFSWNFNVDELVSPAVAFEHIRVRFLANFTLKLLPQVRNLVRFFFGSHFLLEPKFEAFVVDEANWAVTTTRVKERIFASLLITPAHFALDFSAVGLYRLDHPTVNFDCFLFIEFVFAVIVIYIAFIGVVWLWNTLLIFSDLVQIALFYGRSAPIKNSLAL